MSKFDELRDAYNAKKAADQAYWNELFDVVRELGKELTDFLGIPKDAEAFVEGVKCPFLVVGRLEGDDFKLVKAKEEWPRERNSLLVDLMLIIEVDKQKSPEKSVIFRLSIEQTNDGYHITDRKRDKTFPIIEGNFSPLLEHIYAGAGQ